MPKGQVQEKGQGKRLGQIQGQGQIDMSTTELFESKESFSALFYLCEKGTETETRKDSKQGQIDTPSQGIFQCSIAYTEQGQGQGQGKRNTQRQGKIDTGTSYLSEPKD